MGKKQLAIGIVCGLLTHSTTALAQENLDIYGEYIYFKRNDIDKVQLVENTTDQITALSNERKFKWEPGYRVGIICTANCTTSLEVNYLHLNPWRFSRSVSGNQNLLIPLQQENVDFAGLDAVNEKYRVALSAGEANYWSYFTPRAQNYFSFAALFGFHYFRLEEKLQLLLTPNASVDRYSINMRNDMYGLQLGCLLQSNPTDVTYWSLSAKAGGMANNLRLEKSLQEKKECVKPGFFTEVGVQAGWTPARWIKFYLGYQILFLYGIGTAPEQISQKTGCIYHNSKTIFQGASGGIAFTF